MIQKRLLNMVTIFYNRYLIQPRIVKEFVSVWQLAYPEISIKEIKYFLEATNKGYPLLYPGNPLVREIWNFNTQKAVDTIAKLFYRIKCKEKYNKQKYSEVYSPPKTLYSRKGCKHIGYVKKDY